jgi:hypothetical protein
MTRAGRSAPLRRARAKATGLAAALLLALAVGPAAAQGQAPCGPEASARGFLPAALARADFGQPGEICPGRGVDLRLGGTLLVDASDFYGAILGAATLRGRLRFGSDGGWVAFGAIDAPVFRFTVNAVVESAAWDAGPATLGLGRALTFGATAALVHARALLPLDTARRAGVATGGEVGGAALRRFTTALAAQAALTLPVAITVTGGRARTHLLPTGLAEAIITPRPWVAFALGGAVRTEARFAAEAPVLLGLGARAGVVLRRASGWQAALGLEAPIAGADRTNLAVGIFLGRTGP